MVGSDVMQLPRRLSVPGILVGCGIHAASDNHDCGFVETRGVGR
jgi:hypothetical protein